MNNETRRRYIKQIKALTSMTIDDMRDGIAGDQNIDDLKALNVSLQSIHRDLVLGCVDAGTGKTIRSIIEAL